MANDITIDIASIPLAVIRTASDRWIGADKWNNKTNAVIKLAELVKQGYISTDQIRGVTPQPPIMQNSAFPDAFDVALRPVAQVADNANATALEALSKARAIESSLHCKFGDVNTALDDLSKAVETDLGILEETVAREIAAITSKPLVDDAKVAQAVTDAVAAAFKPFNAAVVAAGAQEAVGSMVSVSRIGDETAQDVFGVPARNAAGNHLYVDLFNDPSAPAIDPCFVWTEGILKHLILSQDNGDNLWFGGVYV